MEKMNLKAHKVKRARKHGFLTRMKTNDGMKMIKRRRDQGRKSLAVVVSS